MIIDSHSLMVSILADLADHEMMKILDFVLYCIVLTENSLVDTCLVVIASLSKLQPKIILLLVVILISYLITLLVKIT